MERGGNKGEDEVSPYRQNLYTGGGRPDAKKPCCKRKLMKTGRISHGILAAVWGFPAPVGNFNISSGRGNFRSKLCSSRRKVD